MNTLNIISWIYFLLSPHCISLSLSLSLPSLSYFHSVTTPLFLSFSLSPLPPSLSHSLSFFLSPSFSLFSPSLPPSLSLCVTRILVLRLPLVFKWNNHHRAFKRVFDSLGGSGNTFFTCSSAERLSINQSINWGIEKRGELFHQQHIWDIVRVWKGRVWQTSPGSPTSFVPLGELVPRKRK